MERIPGDEVDRLACMVRTFREAISFDKSMDSGRSMIVSNCPTVQWIYVLSRPDWVDLQLLSFYVRGLSKMTKFF